MAVILLFFEFLLAPFLLTLIAPQLIAAFYAKQTGRSFWFWFSISFVLPIISIIILMYLPDKPMVVESNQPIKN